MSLGAGSYAFYIYGALTPRNYMPGMLGWFKLESSYRPEEIEWIQARSAALRLIPPFVRVIAGR